MILDISDYKFKQVLNDKTLFLPVRWDSKDFHATLSSLYAHYINSLEKTFGNEDSYFMTYLDRIKSVCGLLKTAVSHYLDGFPSDAYHSLEKAMGYLMVNPLEIYEKSSLELFEASSNDPLNLFRVVCVDDNIPYDRKRLFHTPYNLRSKVSTSRYSIAGYPSLYLGTSLDLCVDEVNFNPHEKLALVSKFEIERCTNYNNTHIRVIELAVKPQDFTLEEKDLHQGRHFRENYLDSPKVRNAYLLWYPLIAACSFIRTNKKDPFAAEYIVPQLLMQWVRCQISVNEDKSFRDNLVGIRYFSCASEKASDRGFNYVFPSSGAQKSPDYPYCPILMKAFKLTKPLYLHEYESVRHCETALYNDNDLNFIDVI